MTPGSDRETVAGGTDIDSAPTILDPRMKGDIIGSQKLLWCTEKREFVGRIT